MGTQSDQQHRITRTYEECIAAAARVAAAAELRILAEDAETEALNG